MRIFLLGAHKKNLLHSIQSTLSFFSGDEVPIEFKEALVILEDKRFYQHPGFDLIAILRAVFEYLKVGRKHGASTIEQQLVRTIIGDRRITLKRKVIEIILANYVSIHFTKDEILFVYANIAYFGRHSNGLKQAAETFFSKTITQLNQHECIVLAASLKYPRSNSRLWEEKIMKRVMYFENKINSTESKSISLSFNSSSS